MSITQLVDQFILDAGGGSVRDAISYALFKLEESQAEIKRLTREYESMEAKYRDLLDSSYRTSKYPNNNIIMP